jgi:hypothetical protein
MLNKKESLLRRDQAVSWLWACRKVGFNRDVSRLIASHVFDGFKYIHGICDLPLPSNSIVSIGARYTLQFENGRLIPNGDLPGTVHGEMDERWKPCRLCYVILKAMILKKFKMNGSCATPEETEIIMEILHDTNCGVPVHVRIAAETTSIQTFGDIMKFSPQLDWHYTGWLTPDHFADHFELVGLQIIGRGSE